MTSATQEGQDVDKGAAVVAAQVPTSEEAGAGQVVAAAPQEAGAETPAEEMQPPDPIAQINTRLDELFDTLKGQDERCEAVEKEVAGLSDFRHKAVEAVQTTAEAATSVHFNRLAEELQKDLEELRQEQIKHAKETAQADADVAEIRLLLPAMQQIGQMREWLQRAVATVRAEIAKLQPPSAPRTVQPGANAEATLGILD